MRGPPIDVPVQLQVRLASTPELRGKLAEFCTRTRLPPAEAVRQILDVFLADGIEAAEERLKEGWGAAGDEATRHLEAMRDELRTAVRLMSEVAQAVSKRKPAAG